jgi:hypothetical protein
LCHRLVCGERVSAFAGHWLGIHARLCALASASVGSGTCELAATMDWLADMAGDASPRLPLSRRCAPPLLELMGHNA